MVYSRRLDASGTSPGDLTASKTGGHIDRAADLRAGPPRVGSAAPSAAPKRWAFRILFELPTGEVSELFATRFAPWPAAPAHAFKHANACAQTTEMNCAGSLSVAQVKQDVQRSWEANQRALRPPR